VLDLGYSAEKAAESVLEWLTFARPDDYIAAALAERGLVAAQFGLTTKGSCYQGLCSEPISQGGGWMDGLIEPSLAGVGA